MKKIIAITTLLMAVSGFSPATSHALTPLTGLGDLGAWEGTLDYSYAIDGATAELEIKLKNTSPVANGGYITAFVFNNPLDLVTAASLSATDGDFSIIGGLTFDNSINAAPYGQFDFGASTKNAFQGGGAPQKGIAVGVEETFIFSLSGAQLDTLNEDVFLHTYSAGPGKSQGDQSFVVRYRGFKDGGSDKVPTSTTPEPASMVLFGIGAAGAFIRRKFRV